jgi:hypothetical protein
MPAATTLVVECEFPPASALRERGFVEAAYFRDSYRVPLTRRNASPTEIFEAVFAHHPTWMKALLIVRNRLASLCGLEAPTASEIMHPKFKGTYTVGEKIGVWPIFVLTDAELVAGHDDKHLDFRLSVLKVTNGATSCVIVSTVCVVHNAFGKVYLFFIVPFHKWGVRQLLSRAVRAGRI